jgi:polar amino acid transport system substrate-binding protein
MRTGRGFMIGLMAVMLLAGTMQEIQAADAARVAPVLDRILAKKELVVGTAADMPPLNMTLKDGSIAGMEVDIATMLAAGSGVKLTLKTIHFNDLLPALEAGQFDLILSGMTMTPLRNTRVAFAGPYFGSGKSVLIKEENQSTLGSTSAMNRPEVTLAALKGSTSQSFIERLMPKATFVATDDYDQAIAMVLDGKAQAMIADFPVCNVAAYRYRDKGLATLSSPFNYEPLGIAVLPTDPLLLNLVQNFVTTLVNSGDLEMLRKKWFEDPSWMSELK